jgi:trans-2,3-dihydro-3-hydroxyanthranilate isomerase
MTGDHDRTPSSRSGGRRACRIVRVFTRQGTGGNHLGVVTDPTGLSDDAMQSIAAHLGFSETVFIDRAVPLVRIFTPSVELSFAGHPLVGAAWVLRTLDGSEDMHLDCGAGRMGVRVDGDTVWIDAPVDWPVESDPTKRTGWVDDIDRRIVGMSAPYLLVETPDSKAVADASPPPSDWGDAVMLWSREGTPGRVKARFFAGGLGVGEDPATGSAAVALAALLVARGEEAGTLVVHQGDEIGHPSEILLEWDPDRISIGGSVVHDRTVDVAP